MRLDVPHRIVNMRYYADLVNFLKHRGLKFEREVMQMSYSDAEFGAVLQYRPFTLFGRSLPSIPIGQLLAHPIRYLHLIYDALFFYPRARKDLESGKLAHMTLGEYLDHLCSHHGFTSVFLGSIIIPVLALALTADFDSVRSMPADIPIRYISSGMFSLRRRDGGVFRPVGGVTELSAVLAAPLKDVRTDTQITRVTKLENGQIELQDSKGVVQAFDHLVLATQANHAANLVGHIDKVYDVLRDIKHTKTTVVLHTDSVVMGPWDPRFSFHLLANRELGQAMASVWMNPTIPQLPMPVHQTTNPIFPLDPSKVLFEHTFERPVIDMAAAAAIRAIQKHNGTNNIWFCGSYSLYGMPLLENGARSAFKVAEALTGRAVDLSPPASSDDASSSSLMGRIGRFALFAAFCAASMAVASRYPVSQWKLSSVVESVTKTVQSLTERH